MKFWDLRISQHFKNFVGGRMHDWCIYMRMLSILFLKFEPICIHIFTLLIAELFLTAIVYQYITQEHFCGLFLLHYEPSIFMFWEWYQPIFNRFVFYWQVYLIRLLFSWVSSGCSIASMELLQMRSVKQSKAVWR